MGIEYKFFDIERTSFPVSATDVRKNPFLYWDYIPEAVKPYYRKKVCIYGPESTGKSTITVKLAQYFKTNYVPEVAREYLNDHKVVYEDISVIAKMHADAVLEEEKKSNKVLFVDSDIITTMIYSQFYFGKTPDFESWIINANTFDLYLLFDIDTPWADDPQRDSKNFRKEHRVWFEEELKKRNISYTVISGSWEERFDRSLKAIKEKLGLI